ncbi:uncharacterized protein DS421_13g407320 [Arachis hypogaea]|nr:uncharacterized protein DS421_13g407320 [Arachis hypogaea]
MASTSERLGWGGTKERDVAAAWVSTAALGFGGFGFAERGRERWNRGDGGYLGDG